MASKPLTPEQRARRNAWDRARRAANPEKARERDRAKYAANCEKRRERGHAHYAANPEKTCEQRRAYYAANIEKMRKQSRARHAANPEKQRVKDRTRYAANPEKQRERTRAYGAKVSDARIFLNEYLKPTNGAFRPPDSGAEAIALAAEIMRLLNIEDQP